MQRTACTAKRATSRTRCRTSCGSPPRAAADRITRGCSHRTRGGRGLTRLLSREGGPFGLRFLRFFLRSLQEQRRVFLDLARKAADVGHNLAGAVSEGG